jgi:predicted MFS family arabinose efflux permease
MQDPASRARLIFACCMGIACVAFGIRQGFGLFMRPITLDMNWTREALAATFATQALMIGVLAPLAGVLADRFSPGLTILAGGVLFSAGIVVMGFADTPQTMFAGGGLLAGAGLSACGLPLVLSVIGRVAPAERRSLWLGIAVAGATIGQIVLIPLTQTLITVFDWRTAIFVLAALALLTVPLAGVVAASRHEGLSRHAEQTLRQALAEARGHRGYLLLTVGFFVCGFHVQFIAIHLPAYIADQGLAPGLAASALAVIAVGNAAGSWIAGWLGGRVRKKYLLSGIYASRALLFLIFTHTPISEASVLVFAAILGFLWLGTVPLTSGLVAEVFGTRYMATLYAIVYLSHQMGSFTGVWTGGRLYDATGGYQSVWSLTIALGVVAALMHLFVDDRPVARISTPVPGTAPS